MPRRGRQVDGGATTVGDVDPVIVLGEGLNARQPRREQGRGHAYRQGPHYGVSVRRTADLISTKGPRRGHSGGPLPAWLPRSICAGSDQQCFLAGRKRRQLDEVAETDPNPHRGGLGRPAIPRALRPPQNASQTWCENGPQWRRPPVSQSSLPNESSLFAGFQHLRPLQLATRFAGVRKFRTDCQRHLLPSGSKLDS